MLPSDVSTQAQRYACSQAMPQLKLNVTHALGLNLNLKLNVTHALKRILNLKLKEALAETVDTIREALRLTRPRHANPSRTPLALSLYWCACVRHWRHC